MARRRRSSTGRREPMQWIRGCANFGATRTGPIDPEDCDIAPVNAGVVLFDPDATLPSGNEGRSTIRSIRYPTTFLDNSGVASTPFYYHIWCAVVVTGIQVADIISDGTALGDILGTGNTAPWDILDFRIIQMVPVASTNVVPVPFTPYTTHRDWEVRVQRKLQNFQQVVLLTGAYREFGVSSGITMGYRGLTVVSTLYQRTLR